VASDIPAHREVCAAFATYYDPDDSAALARGVQSVVGGNGTSRNGKGSGGDVPELAGWQENARAVARILVLASRVKDPAGNVLSVLQER
jgi:hypothetical protein